MEGGRDRRKNARQCNYSTAALLPPALFVTYFHENRGEKGRGEECASALQLITSKQNLTMHV